VASNLACHLEIKRCAVVLRGIRQETNEGEKPERKTDGSYRISAGYVLLVRQSFLFSPICQSASLLPPGWLALSAGQLPKQDYPEASEVAFVSAAGANT
jgi:hypothetical protein